MFGPLLHPNQESGGPSQTPQPDNWSEAYSLTIKAFTDSRYEDAIDMGERAIRLAEREIPAIDLRLADVQQLVALAASSVGKHALCIEHLKVAIHIRSELSGPDDPGVVFLRIQRARSEMALDSPGAAILELGQILESVSDLPADRGDLHIAALFSLSAAKLAVGKLEAATMPLSEAFFLLRSEPTPARPAVLLALEDSLRAFDSKRLHKEATMIGEELLKHTLEKFKGALTGSPEQVSIRIKLGSLTKTVARSEVQGGAFESAVNRLDKFWRALPGEAVEERSDTLRAMHGVFDLSEKAAEKQNYFQRLLDQNLLRSGEELVKAKIAIATTYGKRDLDKLESILIEIDAERLINGSEDHGVFLAMQGELKLLQGDPEAALPYLEASFDDLNKLNSSFFESVGYIYARTLHRTGKKDKGRKILKDLLDKLKAEGAGEESIYAEGIYSRGLMNFHESIELAIEDFEKAAKLLSKLNKAESQLSNGVNAYLALAFQGANRWEVSAEILREVLPRLEKGSRDNYAFFAKVQIRNLEFLQRYDELEGLKRTLKRTLEE